MQWVCQDSTKVMAKGWKGTASVNRLQEQNDAGNCRELLTTLKHLQEQRKKDEGQRRKQYQQCKAAQEQACP